ncbi:MAG: hypothetical protein MAG715_00943 [Methanonatronarchaeales archaeon]|nr:hypothetical protein [Methanonatronarchaeales archaeon]
MAESTKDRLVSIRKSDLESLEATVETLQDEDVMRQLCESEKDIEKGRTRPAREFLKEL